MHSSVYVIYDDHESLSNEISSIVGCSAYGELIRKRKLLVNEIQSLISKHKIEHFQIIKDCQELHSFIKKKKLESTDGVYFHLRSRGVVTNTALFNQAIEKMIAAKTTCFTSPVNPLMAFFGSLAEYERYIEELEKTKVVSVQDIGLEKVILSPKGFLLDISQLDNFTNFFSGNFDARHFNSLEANAFTVCKSSSDKLKMRREHDYYYLLPASMQRWFVQPYDFVEDNDVASYAMRRLNTADAALVWIHNGFSSSQFQRFIEQVLLFLTERPSRPCTKRTAEKRITELYWDKVVSRIQMLKDMDKFYRIEGILASATNYKSIDDVLKEYQILFEKYALPELAPKEVIGHGDPCFSNMLYDKTSNSLNFIDPKGALSESELWTDPYYDYAKLSHSVLGLYDFINHGMFELALTEENLIELQILSSQIDVLRDIFSLALEKHHIDIFRCRLFEASLFLSMLPLHIDNPRKVLAFLLNGIKILEELKYNA